MERDAEWMIDDVGHEQGGCCLAMTLRDYGRFGQFILDGARVDGKPDRFRQLARRGDAHPGIDRRAARVTAISGGPATMARSRDAGSTGKRCTSIPRRRLVIVINSATELPTDRASGQARQDFIAAVKAELDAEKR